MNVEIAFYSGFTHIVKTKQNKPVNTVCSKIIVNKRIVMKMNLNSVEMFIADFFSLLLIIVLSDRF